jgi:hypothetical protein
MQSSVRHQPDTTSVRSLCANSNRQLSQPPQMPIHRRTPTQAARPNLSRRGPLSQMTRPVGFAIAPGYSDAQYFPQVDDGLEPAILRLGKLRPEAE